MYENIKYEVKDQIAFVTIDRPKALNALNEDVLKELYDAFSKFESDDAARVAILTGEGKAFVAGADIAAMSKMNALEGRNMMILGHKLMNYMEAIEKPIIAAVNGFALGGGCELSMACDFRLVSTKAKFGQPEVGLGIIPGFGGTQRLPRLVGKGMAKYLTMTAEIIGADEAMRIGLCEKVYEPEALMDEAVEVAQTIISKAPIAVGAAKVAINNGYDMDLKSASRFEIETFTAAFGSDDKAEGMGAFLEKREAKFENK